MTPEYSLNMRQQSYRVRPEYNDYNSTLQDPEGKAATYIYYHVNMFYDTQLGSS